MNHPQKIHLARSPCIRSPDLKHISRTVPGICYRFPATPSQHSPQKNATRALVQTPLMNSAKSTAVGQSDTEQPVPVKKKKRKAPKPGQEGYMTPTQLRNARKRRAKQSQKQSKSDPSQQYLSNPKGAPIVQTARSYFQKLLSQFPVVVGELEGWRTVAKLAARPSEDDQQLCLGLFAPNSHRLIPVPECVAHHPSINAAVIMLEKVCRQTGVQAFDETTGKGHLRYVAVNVERSTGKVQVTLVWNSEPYSEASVEDEGKNVLDAVCKAVIGTGRRSSGRKRRRGRQVEESDEKKHDETETEGKFELHSLWVHYNASGKHSNAIFSIEGGEGTWEHRYGPVRIIETLDMKESGPKYSVPLLFPPNVFRQANIDGFTKIVAQIRVHLKQFQRKRRQRDRNAALPTCLELYGGVGTIGLHIADLTSALVSSDENPFNEACFNESAAKLPADISKHVSYKPMNAAAMVENKALEKAEVVIVDPPRKGLDDTVLQALCTEANPQLLIYVSCGFDAFQRDCNALLQAKWRLDHAEGHLLFPGSDAIETLAVFVANE